MIVETPSTTGSIEPFAMPSLTSAHKVVRAEVFAEARTEGYAAGFAAGHAEGLAQARSEVDAALTAQRAAEAEHTAATRALEAEIARLANAAETLEAAAADLRSRDTVAVAAVEAAVVDLAVELTELALQRELAAPESTLEALRRAVPLTPDRGRPVVRVHPDVVAAVREHVNTPDAPPPLAGADVIGDPAIDIHGCVVDVGDCRVDAQLTTAVTRLRQIPSGGRGAP